MKKIIYACCIILLGGTLKAQQPHPVRPTVTDESQTILKKIQQQWTGLNSAKITFTLQSEKNGKSGTRMQGTLWTQGKSYRLSIPGQTIFCDGKEVWNYLPENNEVSVSPYEEDGNDISINPIQVIATYEKYYRSAFIRETSEKGIAVQIIDLYPKQGQSFYKIRMVIRKDKLLPLRASIHEKDGTVDTYHFDQILKNPKTAPGFFTFHPENYPDVEIIDMRE